jgi:hypothetical protein
MKVTKQTPRDINPIWNSAIVLGGLSEHDRIFFQVKDFGMLSAPALGGMLGPRPIASTSMRVGENYSGYVELEPAQDVAGNGVPLLQVSVRFSCLSSMTQAAGNTGIFTEVFGHRCLGFEEFDIPKPSAPPGQPEDEPGRTDGEPTKVSTIEGSQGSGGQGETGGRQGLAVLYPSSVFYIDPAVYEFSPQRQWIQRLTDLADKGMTHPFPSSPGRNFNVLAAGWDKTTATYEEGSLWQSDSDSMSTELDEVQVQFEKFATTGQEKNHPHWCPDVRVLSEFLQKTKDSCDKLFAWFVCSYHIVCLLTNPSINSLWGSGGLGVCVSGEAAHRARDIGALPD